MCRLPCLCSFGWLNGNDSLAGLCRTLVLPPTWSIMWLLPFPRRALIFCCLECWRCRCSVAFGPAAGRSVSERGWQLASPRHASCGVKLEWVNSSYFSGKWERFLCCQGRPLLPKSTTSLQIISGKFGAWLYIMHARSSDTCEFVCNWESQHACLLINPELLSFAS